MTDHSQAHNEQRAYLQEAIAGLDAVLPIQAPLQDFVHFNPLMHYEHLPFAEALRAAHAHSGSLGYLPNSDYRRFFREGRINRHDIFSILASDAEQAADREIYLTALANNIKAITFQQMRWQVEENAALERFQADVAYEQRDKLLEAAGQNEATAIRALWETCLQKLELHYDLPHPEALLNLRLTDINGIWDQIKQQGQIGASIPDAESYIHAESRELLHTLLDQVGDTLTLRSLLLKLVNVDVMEQLLPLLNRHLASWLDQGIASLRSLSAVEGNTQGFYTYWKSATLQDLTLTLEGMDDWDDYLESLHDDPLETILQELMRSGIDKDRWGGYLRVLALELPGWSGMFNWRSKNPDYYGINTPVSMVDYLAVRLVLEHLYCRQYTSEHWKINASVSNLRGYFHQNQDEFFVRYHAYNTTLPEFLQQLAQQFLSSEEDILPQDWHQLAHQILTWNLAPETVIPVGTDIYRKAWRLFHLAQHLAMDAAAFAQLSPERIQRLLAILEELDDPNTSGYIWLQAYEHHYQEEIFSAVLNKHKETPLSTPPTAQLIFCMDDREESVRRHLEEIAPDVETFGAAGVFGLPNNWRGLDAPRPLKLAQPVVTAVHELREIADTAAQARLPAHQRHQRFLNGLSKLKNHRMRHSVFGTTLALPLLAPFALLELLGRGLLPATYQRFMNKVQRRASLPLKTRVAYTASEVLECPSKEHNQMGLSAAEKVAKVAAFLKLTGFTSGFAPLVVLMAHRSRHLNNPHILGYGCGACSGRFGGPNARAFVGMCNEAEVRTQLATQHGIHIPDGTWFIASEHDTTSDDIDWFDTDLIPASHQAIVKRVQQATEQAARQSSLERCRKFASASPHLTPRSAKRHVEGRAASPDQVRAELGHQGCAVAFIGRRNLSKGVFWDRRSFLISYDPHNDPDGKLLEAQLNGNGVVGVGIQMDYYFSRMQSGYFGSGSKATHNLTGLFGVMEGGASDLRTGLAQQMVELHEPMRLLAIAEADIDTLVAIYQRHEYLRRLLDNGWVLLAAKPPDRNEIHVFQPGKGFVQWRGSVHQLPQVQHSRDWYAGHHGHLPPAAVRGSSALEVNHA